MCASTSTVQNGVQHCERSHRCGLGAKHRRTKRDRSPAGLTRGLALVLRPSALGSGEEDDRRGRRGAFHRLEDRFAAAFFVEEQPPVGGGLQGRAQRRRRQQFRHARAARLLARVLHDAAPPEHSLGGTLLQPLFAALGFDEADRAGAELGCFFQQQLQPLELDERGKQRDRRRRRLGRELLADAEDDVLLPCELYLREVNVSMRGDLVELAGFDTEDLSQVAGLIAFEFGRLVANGIYEEPPSRHDSNLACMIAHLRGTLLEKHPNQAVVEAGGVGYDVTIPVSTYSTLPDTGSEVRLRVHTHVREDALALFGFGSADEKTLFEKLIGVSGIGPKLAITVLSGLATGDLVAAIRGSQPERLVRIPGVGKKTAERMVLELKDKLEGVGGAPVSAPASPGEKAVVFSELETDVLSALVNLGVPRPGAETAIRKATAAGAAAEFEPLFRRALELVR